MEKRRLSCVVVTNLTYELGDPMFKIRLEWYKDVVLPCLLKQKDKDFDIALKVNPKHMNIKVHDKVKLFTEKDYKGYGFTTWENVKGLKKYDIQCNLDSDDIVNEHYVSLIKEAVRSGNMDKPMHIQFQPLVIDTVHGDAKYMKIIYNPKQGSAFYAIFFPDKEKEYFFIKEYSHWIMPRLFKRHIIYANGVCWIVINGLNIRTKSIKRI